MNARLKITIKHILFSKIGIAIVVVICFGAWWLGNGYLERREVAQEWAKAKASRLAREAKERQRLESLKAEWKVSGDEIKARLENAIANAVGATDVEVVKSDAMKYREVMEKNEFDALQKRAEIRRLELVASTTYPDVRVGAYRELLKLDPRNKIYKSELAKAESAISRAVAEAKRAEAATRRTQGVTLGMSQTDVLASKWGRPIQVNRTTNVSGAREQWVYGGNNYLYFENGILTSISN